MALSVPNSRTLRFTPDVVNKMAVMKAASKTITLSQPPMSFTSEEAVASEPLTVDANSDAVLTVAPLTTFSIWALMVAKFAELSAET